MSNTTNRSRLLQDAKNQFRERVIEIKLADGSLEKVGIRTPSLAQAKGFSEVVAVADRAKLAVQMVIQCAFDPDTGRPMFAPEDEAAFLEFPADFGSGYKGGEIEGDNPFIF
jgi:hypothetical protein